MFDPLDDPVVLARRAVLIEELAATERTIAAAQARQLDALAELAGQEQLDGIGEVEQSWTREEVACALRVPTSTASYRIGLAQAVTSRLSDALGMLGRGELSLGHVARLAESTAALSDELTAVVAARVLPGAPVQTVAQFLRQVRRAVAAADPNAHETAHQQAITQRRVVIRAADAGMAELWALLPAPIARTIAAALDHTTQALRHTATDPSTTTDPSIAAADPRTADQLRADALGHWARCALNGIPATDPTDTAANQTAPGARAHIQVTIAASTLAGLNDHPAELDGHGPIPASLARVIAYDPSSRWRRLLLDDTGQLLHYARRTYRPPTALADHVTARDRTCRFPTCNRQAQHTDLDHLIAWNHGGTTTPDNLHALCRRHHRLKHHTRWQPHRHPDGSTTWTTPTNHTYTRPPDPYPIPEQEATGR